MTTIKHIVPLLAVGIHRDITSTPQTRVPEHEIPILQSIHGEGNVYPGGATGETTLLDPATEHDRLARKYGEDAVRDAYGTHARGDIRRAVMAASVGTKEDEAAGIQLEGPDSPMGRQSMPAGDVKPPAETSVSGEPSLAWSKAQLLAHATQHSISIDPTASKPAILAAIEAAAATA